METKDIEAYVTNRLVDFYNALLERGQISPPLSDCSPAVHKHSDGRPISLSLRTDDQPHER